MSGRRRRNLSEAERALWAAVAESVTPLAVRRAPAHVETAPPPAPAPEPAAAVRSAPPPIPAPWRKSKPVAPPAAPPLAGLEPKMRRRLSRGVTAVDARIDLHGLRQDEAHRRLAAFLLTAQASGCKVVLVITGKGRPSDGEVDLFGPERGVLRRSVPIWLGSPAARGCVVGFETAGPTHGGSGALYVRIRKGGVWR